MNLAEILKQREWYRKFFKLHYYRPFEYQKRFHHAEGKGGGLATDRALVAANKIGKCVTLLTKIETPFGEKPIGELFGKSAFVMAWDGREKTVRPVLAWVQKPPEDCVKITMSDGRWIECALGHRVLTSAGYVEARTLLRNPLVSSLGRGQSIRDAGVWRWSQTIQGWIRSYSADFRRCGALLRSDEDSVLVFAPLPIDVPRRNAHLWRWGEWACSGIDSLFSVLGRLSTWGDALRSWGRSALSSIRVGDFGALLQKKSTQSDWLIDRSSSPAREGDEVRFHQSGVSQAYEPLCIDGNKIVHVEKTLSKPVFDMQVAQHQSYCAGGMVHHNTFCGAAEVAFHATGLYPDWWEGHRFKHRVEILCGTESNELTRDVPQKELFGDPEDKDAFGAGAVPKHFIGKVTRKAGVPNALDSVLVKHIKGGWSRIFFRAYEQGAKKHQGFPIHVGWLDEEPPRDIKSQYKRATLNTRGILIHTFTPESGMTEVCNEYFNHPKLGMALTTATWDDCPLFDDPIYKAQVLDQIPEHEREMRSKGIPQMGSGLVFTTMDEEIQVTPFEIPKHWPRIKALDFGIDHPFAAVSLAFDPDTESAYVYWCHRKTRQTIADHASSLNSFDEWIPVAWPHDGLKQDAQSGKPLADIYREGPYHVNMLPNCFSNPPTGGKKEGQGGQGVEVGLLALDEAMKNGKFKVFSHLSDWFEEKRMYHRLDGQVIKERDDLMAATRYAFMSKRFASTEPVMIKRKVNYRGVRNW